MILDFIQKLQKRLAEPLPGLAVQSIMAPESRTRMMKNMSIKNAKLSSVLVLFYPLQTEWHVVLIRRVANGRTHSGQVAFPGGKVEEGDENHAVTAIREAEEELGILPDEISLLGELTELFIPPSNFMVYPFVAYAEKRPQFILQESEVAGIIEMSIAELLDDEIVEEGKFTVRGYDILAPYFLVKENIIWGATAMMLSELKKIIQDIQS